MSSQKMEFKTEIKQLLDLMIHSLYSHKEIFLRELVSNASDAIDKVRYESLTDRTLGESGQEGKITIIADKNAGTLTVRDNGSGLTKEEAIRELGTIAHSGTKEFIQAMQKKEPKDSVELIGQFGVGFYSSFMVADKVTVISRKAGSPNNTGVKWESSADGSFIVEEIEKTDGGTDVILHLKEDDKTYLEEWEIRNIIKKYSDFIEHPIVMEVEKEHQSEIDKTQKVTSREEEILNSRKAIWLKEKSEITESEYLEFYKHISHDFSDPAKVIHFKAEGTSEFNALLYIPSQAPFNIYYKDYKIGPILYVRRVQIMDHCEELLPPYLRFVKGVVDSSDLPLNVSREILQNNRQVDIIKKNITKKVLDSLSDMKQNEYEKYLAFYKEFGKILKEGIHFDFARKETIGDLLLFQSAKLEKGTYTTLQKYVEEMKEGQDEIYYITGTSYEETVNSPYLEALNEKGYSVLVLLDELDDFIMGDLSEYKGKKFKSVIKGDVMLNKSDGPEREKFKKKFEKLIELIKEELKDDVKEVRLSGRLRDSACCLVADEGDMDPQMEKLLKAMGKELPAGKRILEINPDHPLVAEMESIFSRDEQSPLLREYSDLLYNQAVLLEGTKPKDPAAFAKAITKLMVENARQRN